MATVRQFIWFFISELIRCEAMLLYFLMWELFSSVRALANNTNGFNFNESCYCIIVEKILCRACGITDARLHKFNICNC